MTDVQYALLADCASKAVYVRSHDRRWEDFCALIEAGMLRISDREAIARRLHPTEHGLAALREMGR